MADKNQDQVIKELCEKDPRYTLDAYIFVNDALDFAQRMGLASMKEAFGEDDGEQSDHISGGDLCRLAVSYAVALYGMLAKPVLAKFGIRTTDDIGNIVYNLIDEGFVDQSPEDSRSDFNDVFDLGEELEKHFKFQYEKKLRKEKEEDD